MRVQTNVPTQTELISSAKTQNVTSSPVHGLSSSQSSSTPDVTVNLSQISGLVKGAMSQPEVRMDKVEALKSQIAAGTYVVDPQKIAEAMIHSMQELAS